MALTVLTKSTEQQLTNREIQNTGSFKIEANFHLIIFIIKGNEIYLLYTFKKDIDSFYLSNVTMVFRSSCMQRGVLGKMCS